MHKPPPIASLEGITLETIVTRLSETLSWEAMAAAVPVRCFTHDPSVKSSLTFLRRTPWARQKVEQLYLLHARENPGWVDRA
ncbi:MAG: VF530 family protein [Betaproteobacteria bacterium]